MKTLTTTTLLLLLAVLIIVAPADSPSLSQGKKKADANFVWVEGEAASKHNFNTNGWARATSHPTTRDRLSGNDWLTNDGDRRGEAFTAEWEMTIPKKATYQVWTRKWWKHGPFKWRIGKSKWQTCGRNAGLEDNTFIATHLGANWVWMGEAKLSKGKTKLEIELLAGKGQKGTACFDCFCLIDGAFAPRGKFKPGEKSGDADSGKFAFEPDPEGEEEGFFNLRRLNEKEAGESGFITTKKGEFIRGDGKAMRIWGVNIGGGILELSNASIQHLAKMLARRGVNAVRIHTPFFDTSKTPRADIDETLLDRLHFAIAAFKSQGVYSTLSFYFPLWFDVRSDKELEGYEKFRNKRPFAAIFFAEDLQKLHRGWAKALLTTKNPYTKKTLAQEPAIAAIELVNEDSMFFWTFGPDNIPPEQMADLEEQFGAWLIKKYKSVDKAIAAWGWQAQPKDQPKKKRLELLSAWNMTWDGVRNSAPKRKRMSDQMAFFAELQRGYYEGEIAHYRKAFKVKSLINTGNWHTADTRIMEPIEHYTYSVGDMIDRHAYFGGRHQGDASSYAIRAGQNFESRSGLRSPQSTPFANPRYESHPEIYSEFGWPAPNRFVAEWPFLSAAYGSLQGIDGFFHFAINSGYWSHSADKFGVSNPLAMGSFPAYALAYRRGDIEEGKEIAKETLNIDELYNYAGSQLPQTINLDALRGGKGASNDPASLLKIAPFFGKVTQAFGKKAALKTKSSEIKRIEKALKAGKIETKNGELSIDSTSGLATINTDRIAAICGFLKESKGQKIGDWSFMSDNEYISLAAISLDDQKLARSDRILIQAITECRPYGWRDSNGKIENTGGYPMNVDLIKTSAFFDRKDKPTRIVALDANGHALETKVVWQHSRGNLKIKLPENALYTLIEYGK